MLVRDLVPLYFPQFRHDCCPQSGASQHLGRPSQPVARFSLSRDPIQATDCVHPHHSCGLSHQIFWLWNSLLTYFLFSVDISQLPATQFTDPLTVANLISYKHRPMPLALSPICVLSGGHFWISAALTTSLPYLLHHMPWPLTHVISLVRPPHISTFWTTSMPSDSLLQQLYGRRPWQLQRFLNQAGTETSLRNCNPPETSYHTHHTPWHMTSSGH